MLNSSCRSACVLCLMLRQVKRKSPENWLLCRAFAENGQQQQQLLLQQQQQQLWRRKQNPFCFQEANPAVQVAAALVLARVSHGSCPPTRCSATNRNSMAAAAAHGKNDFLYSATAITRRVRVMTPRAGSCCWGRRMVRRSRGRRELAAAAAAAACGSISE